MVFLLGAALLTLGPLPVRAFDGVVALANRLSPVPVPRGAVERAGNVVLFLPLGLLAALLGHRRPASLLIAGLCLLSMCVELAQYAVLAGRHPSLRDVVLNSVGGALGVLAGRLIGKGAARR
ncbi:MAG: VanZ family protein [Frankiales bacterium]|nr:VanZ family protein [Frankiales bacterium]